MMFFCMMCMGSVCVCVISEDQQAECSQLAAASSNLWSCFILSLAEADQRETREIREISFGDLGLYSEVKKLRKHMNFS